MRVGAIYPQHELGGDPAAVPRIGLLAEELGYDHLLAYDHPLGAVQSGRQPRLTGPYSEQDPFHDPFMLFSYLAGITTRIAFVTGILVLPQRQTALVARQAADLALFSGDRLTLGVGVGWNYVEYAALGQPFHERGDRLEEQIVLLRRLWSEPVVEFDGRFDVVDRAGSLPRPGNLVPIWIGGYTNAAIRRAVEFGDGFLFFGTSESVASQWQSVKEALSRGGRQLNGFGASRLFRERNPRRVAEQVEEWTSLGGTHAAIGSMVLGLNGLAEHEAYFEAVAHALAQRGIKMSG